MRMVDLGKRKQENRWDVGWSLGRVSSSILVHYKYLPLYCCIHLFFSCALPMSQGTVLIHTTFFNIFVHSPYPHTFLSTALDKISEIHHMTLVGSAIRWERPLLSSPYASGKSPWLQPPLGRHSYHVLRPHPAAFILIPVSRLKIEHGSFLVS